MIDIKKHCCFLFFLLVVTALFGQQEDLNVVKPKMKMNAIPFSLGEVRLLPGNPFSDAMKRNADYLLSLNADRFLHRWRTNAGLKAKAPLYGGWEQTSSHMLGHYLSALSLEYAASGNKIFLSKANYVVDQLDEIQKARKTGYIGGIPGEDSLWKQVVAGNIVSNGFDLDGAWVPWYMLHKIWAGLLDAYLYTGNKKAKKVVIGLSDWACRKFSNMPDSLFQKMLRTEFGGMNESLAEVYAITGNKKYLDLSYKFYHKQIMDPLSFGEDKLGGLHANTQIPKVIGAARQYELTGNKREFDIADFFFRTVVNDHTYVNGGNSNYESFNRAGKFKNSVSTNTSETCNTYNMLKLDEHLFTWNPSVKLADYYERAVYNHILASQNPETGMLCYYVSLQSGTQKVYSTPYESFWCCVGTGLENHSKYAEDIYFKDTDGGIFINLFIASMVNWREKNVTIIQENKFPYEGTTHLKIRAVKPVKFSMHLRCPSWSKNGMDIYINGVKSDISSNAGSYTTLDRIWKNGDKIELRFDMNLYTESMPDDPSKIAIFYGPLLMAGILGSEKPGVMGVPVLVTDNRQLKEWIRSTDPANLQFTTQNAGRPRDVVLQPFYSVHDQRYIVYWDQYTEDAWKAKKAAYEKEMIRLADIEKRTVDLVRFGEQQSEKDHDLTGENTGIGSYMDRKFRDAPNGGWFSFKVKVKPGSLQLLNTYNGSDGGNRAFEIFAEGIKIGDEVLKGDKPGEYIQKSYTIPADLTKDKDSLTIKFQGLPKNIAGAFFESRILFDKN
jgi:DUF1680 family protein